VPVPTYKLSDDGRLFYNFQLSARLRVHSYTRVLRVGPLVVQISAQRLTPAVANQHCFAFPS
jgi:hypothetical protein